MKIAKTHSHLNGHEWLLVHHPEVWKEIEKIVSSIDAEKCRTKVSKEKTMKGRILYSPIELNREFSAQFRKAGWHETRTSYWVTDDYNLIRKTLLMEPGRQKDEIEATGRSAIFSYNQTDFVKKRAAVEV